MVVFHHLIVPFARAGGPLEGFIVGARGVDIFFVISGFIMYTAARNEPPVTFAWRRFVRIAPLYWVASLTLLVVNFYTRGKTGDLKHLAVSLAFIPHRSPEGGEIWPYLVPGWTLNVEVFFYAVFFLGLVTRRLTLTVGGVILACAVAGFLVQSDDPRFLTYTNIRLLEFLGGYGLGWLFLRRSVRPALLLLPIGFITLMAPNPFPIPAITYVPSAIMIVAGALAMDDRHQTPNLPWLHFLGNASYSIYLTHVIWIALVEHWVGPGLNTDPVLASLNLLFGGAGAVAIGS
ncbi:MAG: hypothetical protein BGN86_05560, partial [Caulobacterales bacterium 68-7]